MTLAGPDHRLPTCPADRRSLCLPTRLDCYLPLQASQISSDRTPTMTSFRDEMAATAQPQSCDFFDKLPLEIRQKIYGELWALHDIRQHVDFDHDDNQSVPVFPCITHSGEEDIRYEEFEAARPAGGEDMTRWEGRLKSPWNTHWKCAEAAAARASKLSGRRISSTDPIRFRTHLDTPLLVCKRM